jgi:hypothetical protein
MDNTAIDSKRRIRGTYDLEAKGQHGLALSGGTINDNSVFFPKDDGSPS